jgi:hypothetical protein
VAAKSSSKVASPMAGARGINKSLKEPCILAIKDGWCSLGVCGGRPRNPIQQDPEALGETARAAQTNHLRPKVSRQYPCQCPHVPDLPLLEPQGCTSESRLVDDPRSINLNLSAGNPCTRRGFPAEACPVVVVGESVCFDSCICQTATARRSRQTQLGRLANACREDIVIVEPRSGAGSCDDLWARSPCAQTIAEKEKWHNPRDSEPRKPGCGARG